MALPGLQTAGPEDGPPDLCIVERPLTDADRGAGEVEAGRRIVATLFDLARFAIVDGREVAVELFDTPPEGFIEARLLGEIMGAVLRQRGLLALHACATSWDGAGILIAGESGWGKSTLTQFLCQNGHTLLTDDLAALDIRDDGVYALPSYPQIRLRPEAAEHLIPGGEGLVRVDRNGPRRANNNVSIADAPVPVRAVLFLDARFEEESRLRPISPRDAFVRLTLHTRSRNLVHVNAPELLRQHLEQCSRVVEAVPTWVLERRRDLDGLAELQALIESAGARLSLEAGRDTL